MKKVLLYSGGTDSWLISKIAKPDIKLFFDIGTSSSNAEMKHLPKDVVIDETLKGLGTLEREDGSFILPLRNLYFIARAAEYGDHIILGCNRTDAHNDKTLEFAEKVQDLLNYYYGPSADGLSEIKDITVDFSYKKYSKAELLKLYIDNGGTVEEYINNTFSCYTPIKEVDKDGNTQYHDCGHCKPCMNKFMAIAVNHFEMPDEYASRFIDILEDKIKTIKEGHPHRYYTLEQFEDALEQAKTAKKRLEENNN